MAGTTPVTPLRRYPGADGEFHMPTTTDEFTIHHQLFTLSHYKGWGEVEGNQKNQREKTHIIKIIIIN